MAGTSTVSAAISVRDALMAAGVAVWADPAVHVVVGHPGVDIPDDTISFASLRTEQTPATFGTNRSRQETVTIEVLFSIWRNGGAEQEAITNARAYQLLGALENYCRKTDPTLGGRALFCFLTASESSGSTAQQTLSQGRCTELSATFTAEIRITG